MEKEFDYEVEPKDPEIRKYFTEGWNNEWADEFFPKRSAAAELKEAAAAFADICKSVFRSKVIKK